MTTAPDWNAAQYLRFEDLRTRPSVDLLARVPLAAAARCVDLGCGPGNSTELVAARFPQAQVEGLDSSTDMLEKARKRLPNISFTQADIGGWMNEGAYDLIFANAVLQWLPDHGSLFPHLVRSLKPGGCLAVQMPDNVDQPSHQAMREVAAEAPWASKLAGALSARSANGSFGDYRRWLIGAGCQVDIWQTIYIHVLESQQAIVEWFKSTALKPFLDLLDATEQEAFLARYLARIAPAYPVESDGKVLLPFPRLFIVATKA